jgi:hypothetical protein
VEVEQAVSVEEHITKALEEAEGLHARTGYGATKVIVEELREAARLLEAEKLDGEIAT